MEALWQELDTFIPEVAVIWRTILRLIAAIVLGGLVGFEREFRGQAAGLRTHMLVALGSCLFALVVCDVTSDPTDIAQLVKGVAAGIGFIGGGAILKLAADREIKGLTTAAGIWLTAAIGVAVGVGKPFMAAVATLLSLVVLGIMLRIEKHIQIDPEVGSDAINQKEKVNPEAG